MSDTPELKPSAHVPNTVKAMSEPGLLVGLHTFLAMTMGAAVAKGDPITFGVCAILLIGVIARMAYKYATTHARSVAGRVSDE